MKQIKRFVVKIGSNVLMTGDGSLDIQRMKALSLQLQKLIQEQYQIVLVSSGAVSAGRSLLSGKTFTDEVSARQVLASVGQVRLMQIYADLFQKLGITVSQVLVTKEDFRDRHHYLNMRNCFEKLLENQIVPIVNENDSVSITELMFTDNDELASLVSGMLDADMLVILTNVDGIYTAPPSDPQSRLIPQIESNDLAFRQGIGVEKSNFGRGGMLTKANMAVRLSRLGISVVIANGKKDQILNDIVAGDYTGTYFMPARKTTRIKKWLAFDTHQEKGSVVLNDGAIGTLRDTTRISSLLPIGIIEVRGEFKKGDLIGMYSSHKQKIGLGIAQYDSHKASELQGQKGKKALIHYDYLTLF